MVRLGETITVINRSGKVVSSSKHLVSAWKEAKSAYRERKAEIKVERVAADERHHRAPAKTVKHSEDVRSRSSEQPSRSKTHRHKPPLARGFTDSCYANEEARRRFEHDVLEHGGREGHRMEIARRHSEQAPRPRHKTTRSHSEPFVDMDLAYGELPPPVPGKRYCDDVELREKASKLTHMLDEANCLQHSATAIIDNLQKNPEAMAAVALTLAEISNMIKLVGPGVVTALKGSFPCVVALLASPQFMIAAGVGVGVTVVALGGYKIVKCIQAQQKEEAPLRETPCYQPPRTERGHDDADDGYAQLDELQHSELSRIEMWRRGIAEIEAESAGTTVDGEFITPAASRHLVAAGVLDEDELKSRRSSRTKRTKSMATSKPSGSRRDKGAAKESSQDSKDGKKKRKQPSGLRLLFRAHSR